MLSVIFPLSSHAAPITGKLTNDAGQPISGAEVHVHGKDKHVTTDQNGNYTINLDADSQLHFSKEGFIDKRIDVQNATQTKHVLALFFCNLQVNQIKIKKK